MKIKAWVEHAIRTEGNDIETRFETLLENVNYHLNEANKQFGVGANK